jgi:hypothetical protein
MPWRAIGQRADHHFEAAAEKIFPPPCEKGIRAANAMDGNGRASAPTISIWRWSWITGATSG